MISTCQFYVSGKYVLLYSLRFSFIPINIYWDRDIADSSQSTIRNHSRKNFYPMYVLMKKRGDSKLIYVRNCTAFEKLQDLCVGQQIATLTLTAEERRHSARRIQLKKYQKKMTTRVTTYRIKEC